MRLVVKRLSRIVTIAAALMASSGSLATGQSLFVMLDDVAFKLTACLSEVEEVRRKLTEPHDRKYAQTISRMSRAGVQPATAEQT